MQNLSAKSSFCLKTNDISLSDTFADYPVSNIAGTINNDRTITTWNSVNFENILNSTYNEYEYFNLRCRAVAFNLTAAYGVTSNDRAVTFYINGLNWSGANYDVIRGCKQNTAVVCAATLVPNTSGFISFEESFILTFQKQKTANLTISMLSANFVTPNLAAGTQMPRISFYFDITPVIMNPTPCIPLAGSKCSTLNAYYLANTTTNTNIDMYAVLGRENFELGAKYNLILKSAMAASWAGTDATLKSGFFLISSSAMRFQNYEVAIGKPAGTMMQLVNYSSISVSTGGINTPAVSRSNTTNIMTFTLEGQFADLTVLFQNPVTNTEYTIGISNTFLSFDIWKCII